MVNNKEHIQCSMAPAPEKDEGLDQPKYTMIIRRLV